MRRREHGRDWTHWPLTAMLTVMWLIAAGLILLVAVSVGGVAFAVGIVVGYVLFWVSLLLAVR